VNIILFGPPGAGKGTQSDIISKNFNLKKISTGDLLRDEIKKNTKIGHKIKVIIDAGKLASDEIINSLITEILENKIFYNRLIFDGYPRNLSQAKNLTLLLEKHNQTISCVLSLNVNKDLIIKRILGRQICSNCGSIFNEYFNPPIKEKHKCDPTYLIKRTDDNQITILDRFETYLEKTLPILEYYKKQNLLQEINGESQIEQIYKEIKGILTTLEAWLYNSYLYK